MGWNFSATNKSHRGQSGEKGGNNLLILAIADDLTGALEIGAKFAARDLGATVSTDLALLANTDCPVLVADTETRHVPALEAATRVRQIVECARSFSPVLIYKKTDSTLRGNIAAELGAIQDAFPNQPLIYVPAYPEMGRTVKDGQLLLWGTPVHKTDFARDPRTPVRDCSIRDLLGGVPAFVIDGECNADIDAAASTILSGRAPQLCAGPSALAGALAERMHPAASQTSRPSALRCLVVNGSLHPASIQQMASAEQHGLFDQNWQCLNQPIEGSGDERALRAGHCVEQTLAASPFDALIVFGGDTAYGIHRALGGHPFEALGEIAPGVPVSKSNGLLWVTKAGGFGPPDILSTIRNRLT